MTARRVACIYPVRLGPGGLAVQSANAIAALADPRLRVDAIGPDVLAWPRSVLPAVSWHALPPAGARWRQWPGPRAFAGAGQYACDTTLGRSAASLLDGLRPDLVYTFTQVALESLRWAKANRVPTILESANGHIRGFRDVYVREQAKWCGGTPYRGHPTRRMVARVEEEYGLADRIRVSSEWARESLIAGGVSAGAITVLQQPVDLQRYRPPAERLPADGPLRVVFVGTLDLRKGFAYLLEGVRACQVALSLELVGGTVDRCTRRLLASLRDGLSVTVQPGDPRGAYARAEIAVLPTLEDGSPFAAAEAMSSGLPLVVTDACGAREWVEPGQTGWIVPAADAGAIARALGEAAARRAGLADMGARARAATEARAQYSLCDRAVAEWVIAGLR